jgi:hypothetical protein
MDRIISEKDVNAGDCVGWGVKIFFDSSLAITQSGLMQR